MENKYYLVPVTAKAVKFDGISFFEMLNVVAPELYRLKKEEIELKYVMSGLSKEEMIIHQKEAEKLTMKNGVNFFINHLPKQIVVVKTKNGIQELATELPISTNCDAFLDVFRKSSEDIVEFFMENESYSENVFNFFNSYVSKKNNLKKDNLRNKAR